jgi:hypothetical protein
MVLAPLRNLSAAEFLVVGLATLGYKNNGSDVTKLRRFRAHFAQFFGDDLMGCCMDANFQHNVFSDERLNVH